MSEGRARSGWDIDLRFGQERETSLAECLMIRGGNHLELKSDQQACTTGNVFVEYRQHGRESGISVTKAHWWTIEVLPNVFVTMPTARMKALVKRAAAEPGRKTPGGDFNAYSGVLVPVVWLLQPWQEAA
jgi:hypothetical protein